MIPAPVVKVFYFDAEQTFNYSVRHRWLSVLRSPRWSYAARNLRKGIVQVQARMEELFARPETLNEEQNVTGTPCTRASAPR